MRIYLREAVHPGECRQREPPGPPAHSCIPSGTEFNQEQYVLAAFTTMQDTKHLPWCLPPGFRRGCGLESQQFGTFSVKEDTVTPFLHLMRGHMNLARPQCCWNYPCFPTERPAFHSACARRWAGMGITPVNTYAFH